MSDPVIPVFDNDRNWACDNLVLGDPEFLQKLYARNGTRYPGDFLRREPVLSGEPSPAYTGDC